MLRRFLSASLLATLLLPALSHAQPQPTPAQPQPAQPAQPAAEPEPDEATVAEARARFLQGRQLAETGNCGGAIVEFEASYRLLPRPGTLFNIAQCQERLYRYDLAIQGYQRYLDEAPPDAEDRGAVTAAMSTLRNLLGTIRITSNVPAEVWVDDHLAGMAPGDVLVPGGRHSVELRSERHIPSQNEVTVAARETTSLDVTLRRAERRITIREEAGLDPWLFWTGVAGTAVLAGIGSVFGIQTLSLASDADAIDHRTDRETQAQDIADSALLADIFFASSFVVAVGTGIIFFLTDWTGDEGPRVTDDSDREGGETAPTTPSARLVPAASPTALGLVLEGNL